LNGTDALDSISRKCDWHVFVRSTAAHAVFDAANTTEFGSNSSKHRKLKRVSSQGQNWHGRC